MYLRKSTRKYKHLTYTNYLLVESVLTPKGPRQRTICSLGNLEPGPPEKWLALADRLQSALRGRGSSQPSHASMPIVVTEKRWKSA